MSGGFSHTTQLPAAGHRRKLCVDSKSNGGGGKENFCRAPKSTDTTSGSGKAEATGSWRPGELPAEAAQHACPGWRCFPGRGGPSACLELPFFGLAHAKHSAVQTTEMLESPEAPQDGAAVEKPLLSRLEAPLGTVEAVTVMLLSGLGDKPPKATAHSIRDQRSLPP